MHRIENQANGKWVIVKENARLYFANLLNDKNEVLLRSENYTSLSGLKSGVDTLKNNIQAKNYALALNSEGKFVFKIFSTANRILCVSNGYESRDLCEKAFEIIYETNKNSIVIQLS